MCGVGLLYSPQRSATERNHIAELMHKSMAHRGPDGFGVESFDNAGVTLFHRRLAIVELSPLGHQPMLSISKRWAISFNGEIYNHQILRAELEKSGYVSRGSSDTEVLLALIESMGVVDALQKCQGMFAIALWDNTEQRLYLIRDRVGEKPLYYGHIKNDIVVTSELKALHHHPEFQPELNLTALGAFLKYNYVPAPHCIYKGFHKVSAGTILIFNLQSDTEPQVVPYWQPPSWHKKASHHDSVNFDAVVNTVHEQLKATVAQEMQADVPLGSFLSGGIDSSVITALMQAQSSRPVQTFSIGFEDVDYNESPYAKQVAAQLKTKHTEWIITGKQALATIPQLSDIYDEPFSDSSQIPTVLLSQLTRSKVTVALSGDGGDELFAGYTRYSQAPRLWRLLSRLPKPMRKSLSLGLSLTPHGLVSSAYNVVTAFQPPHTRLHNLNARLEKLKNYLDAQSSPELFDRILSHWYNTSEVLPSTKPFSLISHPPTDEHDLVPYMLWHDLKHYLPDDIMVKVDRAAMFASLETRAPFLDHKLVELVHSLPSSLVRNPAQPKAVLKSILGRYLPLEMMNRPKMGFAVPLADWLRGDLKGWMLDLLSESRLRQQNLLNANTIKKTIDLHLQGKQDYAHHLWDILVFQSWYDRWIKK